MKRIILVPTLVTLANAFCGVLALSKAIDALAYSGADPGVFYKKMEMACLLVFLGMVFDTLDGFVARLTGGFSAFGAQLDSFADALTFGLVPAILAKVLVEHEAALSGYHINPRISFLAVAAFALMAILRLVRFNLETEADGHEEHGVFRGLPSPAAAGSAASTIWLYLSLRSPQVLETAEGTPTPAGQVMEFLEVPRFGPVLDWIPIFLVGWLPVLGFLMVSNVRYLHGTWILARARSHFFTVVWLVFAVLLFYQWPVAFLFVLFNGFTLTGLLAPLVRGVRTKASTA